MKVSLGKILYAATFCGAVPLILIFWAVVLDSRLSALPLIHSVGIGIAIALVGTALLVRAMWDLWLRGGGLPMNAFPPPRLVSTGAFRLMQHPIYVGFGLIVPGVAIAMGSPAGLWVVTPMVWLAMAALVIGYERIDLDRRFGPSRPRAWLALPADRAEPASFGQRIATVLMVFGPWLIAYQACVLLGSPGRAIDTMLPFERNWPVWEWTAVFYLGAYTWTLLAPAAARSQSALHTFGGTALWGTGTIAWFFLAFPFVANPRPIDTTSLLGELLKFDRSIDTIACAFPSFHVFWAFACADLWADRLGKRASLLVAALIAASCVTTGVHSIIDVAAGWLVYLGAAHRSTIWAALRRATERFANSWHDWRLGPVRIINHGGYVGGATTLGLWLVGLLLGPEFAPAIVIVALCSIFGAGIWGQWLEASSQLSRPFGYFGGLFGGCVGVVGVQLWLREGWYLAAAFAVAAPVIQAVGRLRCLVQGCCHGRPTEAWLGIRYTRPLSRVCKLAKLEGVPLHATPLYSILGNFVILGLLARLWFERADASLIAGGYLILSTCARFMEEGYRGEPQTVRWGGLPIYQWLAIGCLLAGIALTSLPAPVVPVWSGWSFAPLSYSVPIGLIVWCAMGVDFPESHRRMSRLA